MSVILVYRSNNSGGNWWLSESDWQALSDAGWTVGWLRPNDDGFTSDGSQWLDDDDPEEVLTPRPKTDYEWLGASATTAAKRVPSVREGVEEWERITGESASSLGCNCCGPPHSFTSYDEETGEHNYHYTEAPLYGEFHF